MRTIAAGTPEPVALGHRIPGDLARAEDDPLDGRRIGDGRVVEELVERAGGELVDVRTGLLHAQALLGREHDQWRVPLAVHLAPQEMEVLRRGGGVDELHVVLGGEHEEALDAGRRMLGPLALVAVRQEQHQPVALTPLVLGGDDVLVDDDLGAVDEIAELGLPHDQRIGVGVRVAVLETRSPRTRRAASRRPRSWPWLPRGRRAGSTGRRSRSRATSNGAG